MSQWNQVPQDTIIEKTARALSAQGMETVIVANGNAAKEKVFSILPKGAEVMDMTSRTLDIIGVAKIIQESGNYTAVRLKLMSMDRKTQGREMQKLGAAPEWTIGSVHAVTEKGQLMIASNTGSQLPAYAYGSSHVIWVVGAQKIVPDIDTGMKRIYQYSLPLEAERARKAYGTPGSNVSKMLIVNKEVASGRITVILVKEAIGF